MSGMMPAALAWLLFTAMGGWLAFATQAAPTPGMRCFAAVVLAVNLSISAAAMLARSGRS